MHSTANQYIGKGDQKLASNRATNCRPLAPKEGSSICAVVVVGTISGVHLYFCFSTLTLFLMTKNIVGISGEAVRFPFPSKSVSAEIMVPNTVNA